MNQKFNMINAIYFVILFIVMVGANKFIGLEPETISEIKSKVGSQCLR